MIGFLQIYFPTDNNTEKTLFQRPYWRQSPGHQVCEGRGVAQKEAEARGGVDKYERESGQNWALLTLEMLLRTPSGVTSPTTVTFFVAMSMSKEVTPGLDAGLYVLVIQTELEVKG